MNNDEKYKILSRGAPFEPSVMGVISSEKDYVLCYDTMSQLLGKSTNCFKLLSFELSKDIVLIEKKYLATVEYLSLVYVITISELSIDNLRLEEFGLANMINEDDFNTALSQSKYLSVSFDYSKKPLESFHFQLKILNTLVPKACLVIDFMSFRLLSGKWLKLTAGSQIPPSPDYLYSLHAVYDEKEEATQTRYWFHTHGLVRCGLVEMEILYTSGGTQQMYDLIHLVVKRMLSNPPKENEKFNIGFDGLDLSLIWLRWETALTSFPENILGGLYDREGDNNTHNEPSGVLFAVEDGNLISPEIYVSTLSKNPILFVSTEETLRMSRLATERFSYFLSIYAKVNRKSKKSIFHKIFNQPETDRTQWSFMVKLGLVVDDAHDETEREHLWFKVVSATEQSIEGKLLNQPYWIASLKDGDVKSYPIELLTDWIIYDPEGNEYTPDSIYQLNEDEEDD